MSYLRLLIEIVVKQVQTQIEGIMPRNNLEK